MSEKQFFGLIVNLILGICASLVASYLYAKGKTSDWWFKILISFAALFLLASIVLVTNLYIKMKLAIAATGKIFDLENENKLLNSKIEKKDSELLDIKVQLVHNKNIVKNTAELSAELIKKEGYIDKLVNIQSTQNKNINSLQKNLDNLESLLSISRKTGMVDYIDDMTTPEFSEIINNNFIDSKFVYVLASRGHTLFGPQIEPFHSLFRSLTRDEIALHGKEVKIILSNPILNLERTRRIMDIYDPKHSNKVMASYYGSVEEILKLSSYCDLQLRLHHQTATWRLIIFENMLMFSSYRKVKKLPIYIIERKELGLYDGFLYHFEKLFEFSEIITSVSKYKNIIRQSSEMVKKGTGEFTLNIGDKITGI